MNISNFVTEGRFDEIYFRSGIVYTGVQREGLNIWDVIDDLGHTRAIIPNTLSPHLITRFIDLYNYPRRLQNCTGKFVFFDSLSIKTLN